MTRIPYVMTYNPQLPNIKDALNNNWDILQNSYKIKEYIHTKADNGIPQKQKFGRHSRTENYQKWLSRQTNGHQGQKGMV